MITITNLEVIVSPYDATRNYVQFYFNLTNDSGEDILPGQSTYVNIKFNTNGSISQHIDRYDVPAGQQLQLLSKRHLVTSTNTLAEFEFIFPVSTNNQVTVLRADAFVYDPFATRIDIDMHQIELDPTRSGYAINPDNWFATYYASLKNYFLEDYELRQIDFIYDDGTSIEYPLPADTYVITKANSVQNYTDSNITVSDRPVVGGTAPIYVRKDKTVVAIRNTFTPVNRWEPVEVYLSPAEVENNYLTMLIEATTSGNSIYINVTRGVAPYTYRWNDGVTTQNRENVAPGLYTVTVTDAIGYTAQASVQLGDLHYFSENPVTLKVNVTDHSTKPFLRVVCEVWIERDYLSDSYEKIFEAEQPVDSLGNTLFNLQQILDSSLQPQLPAPSLQRQEQQFKRFYLRYYERYGAGTPGDPETTGGVSQVQESYLLMGGLSDLEYSRGNFFGLHFAQKPFYTWQPLVKEIYPDQPEWLTFVVNSFELTGFEVAVKLYYIQPDGSEISQEHVIFTQTGVNKYEPYSFPVGPAQLNLPEYYCQELDRYEIYVKSGDTIISEVRTYLLRYETNRYKRYFLYQNSLGGWDTLCTTGKAEYELGIDTEALERYLPPDHSPLDRPTRVMTRTAMPEIKVSSGHKSKAEMKALQDFFLSKEPYLLEEKESGLVLTPVEVDVRNITVLDEDSDLQNFSFSLKLQQYSKYTPELLGPAEPGSLIQASATITGADISLAVSGGLSPYIFAWSDGSTAQNRTGLANGSYDVLIRDSNSPRQAYSICALQIEGSFEPAPASEPAPAAWYFDAQFSEEPAVYNTNPPGHYFVWPDTISVGGFSQQVFMVQDVDLRAGTNRINLSVLLPSGADAYLTDKTSLNANNINTSSVMVQELNPSLFGAWQQLSADITSDIDRRVIIRFGWGIRRNTSNAPTFYASDFQLDP
jgi:hypothetical protein